MTEWQKKRHELRKFFYAAALFTGLGVHMAATVLVCTWLGQRFDARFATHPVGVTVGILAGFPLAIYSVYRRMKDYRA